MESACLSKELSEKIWTFLFFRTGYLALSRMHEGATGL